MRGLSWILIIGASVLASSETQADNAPVANDVSLLQASLEFHHIGSGDGGGDEVSGSTVVVPTVNAGSLGMDPPSPCKGKIAGESCTFPQPPGMEMPMEPHHCEEWDGEVFCAWSGPCHGKTIGEACTESWDQSGTPRSCEMSRWDEKEMMCAASTTTTTPGTWVSVCEGKEKGDECVPEWCLDDPTMCPPRHVCNDYSTCEMVDPCDGKLEGDTCEWWMPPMPPNMTDMMVMGPHKCKLQSEKLTCEDVATNVAPTVTNPKGSGEPTTYADTGAKNGKAPADEARTGGEQEDGTKNGKAPADKARTGGEQEDGTKNGRKTAGTRT